MISSKRIGILTAVLMVLVLGFTGAVMLYGENQETKQTGTVVYADGFELEWTEEDYDTSAQNAAFITLTGESAETDSANVLVNGSEISILGGGTYVVSGTLENGTITVNAEDNSMVHLILNNASVTSSNFAALYVTKAGKMVVTLAENSENTLTDSAMYDEAKQNDGKPFAALYSHDDLTINGNGTLTVRGNYQDGIKCNDTMKIIASSIQVTAVDEGINANDCLAVLDAELEIHSGGDSLHSDGSLVLAEGEAVLSSGDDAVHAEQIAVLEPKTLQIAECLEGIEGAKVIIKDGDIRIVSKDDAINAIGESASGGMEMMMGMQNREISEENVYLMIDGGSLYLETSGDGIDSNGAAVQNGGTIEVYGPENSGNASLDAAYGLQINGGSLIAAGSSGMAELPHSSSSQNALIFYLEEPCPSGSYIELMDNNGKTVLTGTSPKQFNWVCVSDAAIQQGTTYALQINGEPAASLECTETVSSSGTRNGFGGMLNMGAMPRRERGLNPEETADIPQRADTIQFAAGRTQETFNGEPPSGTMPENMQTNRMPKNMPVESTTENSAEQYGLLVISMLLLAAGFVFVCFYKRKNY